MLKSLIIAVVLSFTMPAQAQSGTPDVTQVLRDTGGKLIGKIKQRSDGKFEARDANYRLRGVYDPKRNETYDSNAKPVGQGNFLSSLLTQ